MPELLSYALYDYYASYFGEKKSKSINLKISSAHLDIIKKDAEAMGYCSLSSYIRDTLLLARDFGLAYPTLAMRNGNSSGKIHIPKQ